jgi:hypothetical protein
MGDSYKFIIYKTTNKVNGKIYIGAHMTKNIEDDYLGSGKYLIRAINKYGVENFYKEIIAICETSKDMYDLEAKLVCSDFIKETSNYNMKIGGFGGWNYVNSLAMTNEHKEKIRKANLGKTLNSSHKEKIRKANLGRKASKETKEKMSLSGKNKIFSTAHKENLSGKRNTNFEKIRITNGIEFKQINKGEEIPDGWSNMFKNKIWIHNFKEQKRILKHEEIPDGWHKGMFKN